MHFRKLFVLLFLASSLTYASTAEELVDSAMTKLTVDAFALKQTLTYQMAFFPEGLQANWVERFNKWSGECEDMTKVPKQFAKLRASQKKLKATLKKYLGVLPDKNDINMLAQILSDISRQIGHFLSIQEQLQVVYDDGRAFLFTKSKVKKIGFTDSIEMSKGYNAQLTELSKYLSGLIKEEEEEFYSEYDYKEPIGI